MKNHTQEFAIGDTVEIINKRLKTFGQTGTICELEYTPYRTDSNGTIHTHDYSKHAYSCVIKLLNGKKIRTNNDKIKLVTTIPSVKNTVLEIGAFYQFTQKVNRYSYNVVVLDNEFNRSAPNGYYHCLTLAPDGFYKEKYLIIHANTEQHKKHTNIHEIELLEKALEDFNVKNSIYCVTVDDCKVSSIQRITRSDAVQCSISNHNASFTVNGTGLEKLVSELVTKLDIEEDEIKVYKLGDPQSVKVNIDVNISF